jgi:hypothetical protein
MNTDMQNIESDEISFKRINRERKRVVCLSTSQWKIILLAGIVGSRFWFYSLSKPVYTATFIFA